MPPTVSICIPAYEMHGKGPRFLREALDSILCQTFQDIEIIVSDHSQQCEQIKSVCDRYPVKYFKNVSNYGSSSANINYALDRASGAHIKILFQDDFLAKPESLGEMITGLEVSGKSWLATGCLHTDENSQARWGEHFPRSGSFMDLALGKNGLGAPSVILFKRTKLRFDERLIWLMDCDFYLRLLQLVGPPCLVDQPLVIVRVWEGSITNSLEGARLKDQERQLLLNQTIVCASRRIRSGSRAK